MNKQGITFFLTMMLGLTIIILGLALVPVIKDFNEDARNTTTLDGADGLDCNNSSISDFQSAACLSNDITTYGFGGLLIAIGLAVILGKIMWG